MTLPVCLGHYEVLAALAVTAQSYLEVGTHEGGSLQAVLTANPSIQRVTCCDNWAKRTAHDRAPHGHAHIDQLLREMAYQGAVTFLEGDSAETVPAVREMFDLTVVDGDHRSPAVDADLAHVLPLTRHAMVVHDIWPKSSVRGALHAFLAGLPAGSASVSLHAGDHGTAVVYRS
jgi:predicted O-methyltransferase YrrM